MTNRGTKLDTDSVRDDADPLDKWDAGRTSSVGSGSDWASPSWLDGLSFFDGSIWSPQGTNAWVAAPASGIAGSILRETGIDLNFAEPSFLGGSDFIFGDVSYDGPVGSQIWQDAIPLQGTGSAGAMPSAAGTRSDQPKNVTEWPDLLSGPRFGYAFEPWSAVGSFFSSLSQGGFDGSFITPQPAEAPVPVDPGVVGASTSNGFATDHAIFGDASNGMPAGLSILRNSSLTGTDALPTSTMSDLLEIVGSTLLKG